MKTVQNPVKVGACAALIVFGWFAGGPTLAAPRPTVIDNSFKPDLPGWNIGSIRSVVQSDGRLVVAGLSNGVPVITRLNEDGSRDGGFKLDLLFLQWWPNGEQGSIEALAVQPDGKILVAEWAIWFGQNREYNYKNRLVRLNQDGSLDPSFKPPSELPVHIDYLQALSDGRVFMADNPGGCGEADGREYLHNRGVLLTGSGSVDPQFSRVRIVNKTTCGPFIGSASLSSEGKLLVAGQFIRPGTNVIRINANGTLDTSFKADLPQGWDQVSAVTVQSDGKVVAALARSNRPDSSSADEALLIRLLPDGRADPSFIPAQEASHYRIINALTVRDGDKILIAPDLFFHGYSLRLKRDGALDLDLAEVADPLGTVSAATVDQEDRVVGLLTFSPSPNIGASSWGWGPHKFSRFFTQGRTIPGIEFAQARYSVKEDESAATIMLRRSGDVSKPLSVRLRTQDGTAKTGADYIALNEMVQMAAGEETRAFQVPIRDDPAVEGNETILLALSEPSFGTVISGRDGAVLAIVDNERPTLLDPTFQAEFDQVSSPGSHRRVAMQPDGKVLVAGQFASFTNGSSWLIRLRPDGSADPSFHPPQIRHDLLEEAVQALEIQADGKILVGGTLTNINNTPCTGLVRLNHDGSLDAGFNPVLARSQTGEFSSAPVTVAGMAVQPDGKILVAGGFATVNGSTHHSIVRLNPNGTTDPEFVAQVQNPAFPNDPGYLGVMLLQPDGRILIDPATRPTVRVNGKNQARPVRLNSDGTTDESFVPANTFGNGLILTSEGKILSWMWEDRVRRFNRDGSEDESWTFTLRPSQSVWALLPAEHGESWVGVTELFGTQRLLRLSMTGAPIGDYPLVQDYALSLLAEAKGAFLVSGSFDGVYEPLARLLPLDNTTLGVQFSEPVLHTGESSGSATVTMLRTGNTSSPLNVDYVTLGDLAYAGLSGRINFAPLETSRTLSFSILDDHLVNPNRTFAVVLTNASPGVLLGSGPSAQNVVIHDDDRPGSLDFTFTRPSRSESDGNSIEAVALQADGKILTAGVFLSPDGERYTTLERLNQDGSHDDTFEVFIEPHFGWGVSASISFIVPRSDGRIVVGGKHPVTRLQADGSIDESFDAQDTVGEVNALSVQADEKVLVAGSPPSEGQPAQPVLVRFQSDGRLDPSFAVATNITQVTALAVQPDGRILAIAHVDGRSQLLRLENRGTVDPTFRPAAVATNRVPAFALQNDSKILLQALGGNSTERLVRLNTDGSLDPSFVDLGGGESATAIAVQSDGRILLADGHVWRLNPDGSVDTSFDSGPGPQGSVNHLRLQPNGRVIVAGTFAEFDGVPRRGIARLNSDSELRFTGTIKRPHGSLELTWTSLPGRQYILEISQNLRDWTAMRTIGATTYSCSVEDLPPAGSSRFYRVLRGTP